jgi:hypothetical protein
MQVQISPALVTLLETNEIDEQSEALQRLWREIQNQIERQKERTLATKQDAIIQKRARFSFD